MTALDEGGPGADAAGGSDSASCMAVLSGAAAASRSPAAAWERAVPIREVSVSACAGHTHMRRAVTLPTAAPRPPRRPRACRSGS